MRIIFYGCEGSGKSTQAKMLAQKLGVPHLVSGDIVRQCALADKGELGDICREALKKGQYVPDEKMQSLWMTKLRQEDSQKGWVIDGFPRTLEQAKFLQELLKKDNQKITLVFYLKLSLTAAISRLLKRSRKNPDGTVHDTPKIIKKRLQNYQKNEEKILDFYKKEGLLEVVNAHPGIEEIFRDISQKIAKFS